MDIGAKGLESVMHRVGTGGYNAKTTVKYMHPIMSLPSETSATSRLFTINSCNNWATSSASRSFA
jgi:hypothetical protein